MAKITKNTYGAVTGKSHSPKVGGGGVKTSGVHFNGFSKDADAARKNLISNRDIKNEYSRNDDNVKQEASFFTSASMAPKVAVTNVRYIAKDHRLKHKIKVADKELSAELKKPVSNVHFSHKHVKEKIAAPQKEGSVSVNSTGVRKYVKNASVSSPRIQESSVTTGAARRVSVSEKARAGHNLGNGPKLSSQNSGGKPAPKSTEELMRKCGVISREKTNEGIHRNVQDARRHVALADKSRRTAEPKVCSVQDREKIKKLQKEKKKLQKKRTKNRKSQGRKRSNMAKRAMIRNFMIKNAMNPENADGSSGIGELIGQMLKQGVMGFLRAIASKILLFLGGLLLKVGIVLFLVCLIITPVVMVAYVVIHPISFFLDGTVDDDTKNDENYLSNYLAKEYELFDEEIEKFSNADENNILEYNKQTGVSNFNDVAAAYLSKVYGTMSFTETFTNESDMAPHLIIDKQKEKDILKEVFEEMNYTKEEDIIATITSTKEESEMVYNPEIKKYERVTKQVEVTEQVPAKKMTVYTLSLNEWKAEKGSSLSEITKETLAFMEEFVSDSSVGGMVGGIYVGEEVNDGQVKPFYVYSQSDLRWGSISYYSSTYKTSGCGPSACAMVISSLTGQTVDPPAVGNWAMANGRYYVDGKGSTYGLIGDACSNYGLAVQRVTKNDGDTIRQALKDGKLCICIMGAGDFTSSGHFIVLRGIRDDGLILVGDSAGSNGKKRMSMAWDLNRILTQVKAIDGGGVWIISK